MKSAINRLLPILFVGMFVYSGCAKQGVVKSDEPLVPAAAKTAVSAPLGQAATTAKAVEKSIAPTNTKATPVNNGDQDKSQKSNETSVTADLQKKLDKIFFDFDSSTLSDKSRQTLARDFAILKQSPQLKIRIEGNCDERGSDEYNLALGERRAKAAARYLTDLGMSGERLTTVSYGKEKPADPGHDETAWAKNRRDEFVVTGR